MIGSAQMSKTVVTQHTPEKKVVEGWGRDPRRHTLAWPSNPSASHLGPTDLL